MSEMKHTPGPWSAKDWRVCASVNDAKQFRFICDTANNKKTRNETNAANANLIAAAPDLLAACEAAMRIVELWCPALPVGRETEGEYQALHSMRMKFRKAIAKAKGESQ